MECEGCNGTGRIVCLECWGGAAGTFCPFCGGEGILSCTRCSGVARAALWTSGSGWSHPAFTPVATGVPWADAPQPPSLAQARAQYPDARVVMRDTRHRLYVADGAPSDWWHNAQEDYDVAHVMHLRGTDGTDHLLAGVALDPEIRDVVLSRAEGRYAFFLTRSLVVLVGFHDAKHHIELSGKLRHVHRPRLALRYAWPKSADVERALRA